MGTRNVKNLQAYKLPKRSERWLHQFIAEASADVTAVSWNVNWNYMHGEGRTTTSMEAGMTFHIGFRRTSDGHYRSAVTVDLVEGDRRLPVVGTEHDFGTTEPTLVDILNHYKAKYGKPLVEASSETENGAANDDDAPAEVWRPDVQPNAWGTGHYYIDQEGNNISCDKDGVPVPSPFEYEETE